MWIYWKKCRESDNELSSHSDNVPGMVFLYDESGMPDGYASLVYTRTLVVQYCTVQPCMNACSNTRLEPAETLDQICSPGRRRNYAAGSWYKAFIVWASIDAGVLYKGSRILKVVSYASMHAFIWAHIMDPWWIKYILSYQLEFYAS